MTRLLFLWTAIAGSLFALTALLIRAELATPGISPLFSTADGAPDGAKFYATSIAHSMLAHLTVILLGTTMISAARDKGAPNVGIFVPLGAALATVLSLLLAISAIPTSAFDGGTGAGWVLYPPLSTSASLLDRMLMSVGIDPILLVYMPRILILLATTMLYIGAFAMVATLPRLRWVGLLGAGLSLLAVALQAPTILTTSLRDLSAGLAITTLPFAVLTAGALFFARPPWLILLSGGAFLSVAGTFLPRLTPDNVFLSDTVAAAALLYLVPTGLAWAALPALVMFWRGTSHGPWRAAVTTVLLWIGLAVWIVPLLMLGRVGMPILYPDYPNAFAELNLWTSRAVLTFAVFYAALLMRLWRIKP